MPSKSRTAEVAAVPRCSKLVWGFLTGYPCTRKGVVDRDGQWFCRQHDPVARKQKEEAHDAERRARWARKDAEHKRAKRIAQAERHVIEQARLWAPRSPAVTPEDEDCERQLRDAVRALEEASKLAKPQEQGAERHSAPDGGV